MSGIAATKQWLSQSHILVPDDWLQACVDWIQEENQGVAPAQDVLNSQVYEQWLLSDLHELETRCLPTELPTAAKFQLNGAYALQIDGIVDVGKSFYSQQQKLRGTENANSRVSAEEPEVKPWEMKPTRMLKMMLSDGQQSIQGMEYKPISSLSPQTPPGSKILVHGSILCRHGVLMLGEASIKFLGGEVDTLIEANSVLNTLQSAMDASLEHADKSHRQEFGGSEIIHSQKPNPSQLQPRPGQPRQQQQPWQQQQQQQQPWQPSGGVKQESRSRSQTGAMKTENKSQIRTGTQSINTNVNANFEEEWEDDPELMDAFMEDMDMDDFDQASTQQQAGGRNPHNSVRNTVGSNANPNNMARNTSGASKNPHNVARNTGGTSHNMARNTAGTSRGNDPTSSSNSGRSSGFMSGTSGDYTTSRSRDLDNVNNNNNTRSGLNRKSAEQSDITSFTKSSNLIGSRGNNSSAAQTKAKSHQKNTDHVAAAFDDDDFADDMDFEDDMDLPPMDFEEDNPQARYSVKQARNGPREQLSVKCVGKKTTAKTTPAKHESINVSGESDKLGANSGVENIFNAGNVVNISSMSMVVDSNCVTSINMTGIEVKVGASSSGTASVTTTQSARGPVTQSVVTTTQSGRNPVTQSAVHVHDKGAKTAGTSKLMKIKTEPKETEEKSDVNSYFQTEYPFTYINKMMSLPKQETPTVHTVKAYISTLISRLTTDNGVWSLACKINDGTMAIDVDISDKVLTEMIGFSCKQSQLMRLQAKQDPRIKHTLKMGIQNFQQKLVNMMCLLEVEVSTRHPRPVVVATRPVSASHIDMLYNRVMAGWDKFGAD